MRYLMILGLLGVSFVGCSQADPVTDNTNITHETKIADNRDPGRESVVPQADVHKSNKDKTESPANLVKLGEEVDTIDVTSAETGLDNVAPRPAWTTSRVHGSPDPPLPFQVEEVFDGLSFYAPVFIQQIPGTEQYLIGELCGRIYSIDKNSPDADPELVIDLFAELPNRPPTPARGQPPVTTDNPLPGENLYDLIFHPNFDSNRQVFLTYVPPGGGQLAWLSRMELSTDDPPRILRESETLLLSWPAAGHNGGCVRFGPDGFLYISTGDGVGPNPPDANDVGQDISNPLSSILRIDVDNTSGDTPYAIPEDNPFVDTAEAMPEVWAYGFRNPWKMDFDRDTGNLWVGDVGWETWEMVHYVTRGGNYGWPVMEGRKPLRSEVKPGPTPISPPAKDYPRTEANSVTGGIVYSGKKYPELAGWFIHGDYRTGHIWAIKLDEQGEPQHRHLARSSICIIAFLETADGEILVMDHDVTGRTCRLVPSPPADTTSKFPRNLEATGLFTSVAAWQPAPGVIPYQVTVQPWMDGAYAERLLALPADTKIATNQTGGQSRWKFPEGTVLVQTVNYRANPEQVPVRLETRILHFEKDTWRAYSYRWNDAQTNAELAAPHGEQVPLPQDPLSDSGLPIHETWRIVSRAECVFCHRDNVGSVLGFVPAQLNRPVDRDDVQHNQLELLAAMGVFEGDPLASIDKASSLVNPHDNNQNFDDRARSYLDVNCGVCHNPHGESISMFYLRRRYSLEDAKAFKKVAIGTFGLPDPHLIVPGDPYRSAALYRLGKLGNARMPYVGSRVVDTDGFLLIHDWIESMDGDITSLGENDRASLDVLNRKEIPEEKRSNAVSHLLSTTSGAFALMSAVRAGGVSADLRDQIVELSQQSTAATVRSLFEDFVPESQRRPTLGDDIQPEAILKLAGDAARGKLIYLSDSSRCRICHVPDEHGRSLGADLKEVGKKYPKPELLRHIIEPSLKMEPAVVPHLVETVDGKLYSGVIVERNNNEIVIQNARLDIFRIPSGDVETLEKLDKSIMPERLLSDMTAQEAADLLEYLSTLRGD